MVERIRAMIVINRFRNRFLLYLMFAVTGVKMLAMDLWNVSASTKIRQEKSRISGVKQGSMLHVAYSPRSSNRFRQYALEVTGVFPFVKVVSLSSREVPAVMDHGALLLDVVAHPYDLQVAGTEMYASIPVSLNMAELSSCTSC